jgi:uncharacterized repeat protein (TIGR02543 family)
VDYTNVKQDLEIKPIYELKTYQVVFKDNDNLVLSSQSIKHGSDALAPTIKERPGFTFIGWDKEFTNISSDLEIIGQFTSQTFSVNFITNGGSAVNNLTNISYGYMIDLPTPTKKGYLFRGWSKESNINAEPFYNSSIVTSNFNLYARWEHTHLGDYEFAYDESVQKYVITNYNGNEINVLIPDSFNYIDVYKIGNSAFKDKNLIKSVEIPNSIIYIDAYAFENCSSLVSLTIPNSVESIGDHAFAECISLESVALSENITLIDIGTFFNCKRLTNIIIPETVINISEDAFFGCTSLTSIIIPNTVVSIGEGQNFVLAKGESSDVGQCAGHASLVTRSMALCTIFDDLQSIFLGK